MFLLYIIIAILIIFIDESLGRHITLNALAFTIDPNTQGYTTFLNKFNKYSKENDLDITVNLNLLSIENATSSVDDYKSMIESLIQKKEETKYHIYFYDNTYIEKYGPHLLDLSECLDKDHIDLYDSKLLDSTCIYDNKLVGLPFTIGFSVLYSNMDILNKYHKPIPKTWDELVETGKYILEEERKLNNKTDLLGYNGFFCDDENGTGSLYEFLYSFRDTKDSPMPYITSKSTKDALEMIKTMKDEISSDSEFLTDNNGTFMKLMNANDIFIRFWFFFDSLFKFGSYSKTVIPGSKDGISTTTVVGYNVGISNYIKSEDELKAAIEVFKYITSKEIHKEGLKMQINVPGIFSLYKDKEVCPDEDCKIFEELQFYKRPPLNISYDIDEYSNQFRHNIYDFIYGNKTVDEVTSEVEDITKIYYITTNLKESSIGFVTVIILISISVLMLISFIFPFRENFAPFFKFMPLDLWFISVIGSILIMSIIYTEIGPVTRLKCHMWIFLLNYGLIFNYIPFLYKLISKFPGKNDFLLWICNHKYFFFLFFLLIDTLLCFLLVIKPYNIETRIVREGRNFQQCKMNNLFQHIITNILVVCKGLIIFTISIFVFMEWNIHSIHYDLKFNIAAIYIDILSFIIIEVLSQGEINNYIWKFNNRSTIILIMSLSNYILMYGYRLFFAFLNKQNIRLHLINSINKNFVENVSESDNKTKMTSFYIQTQTNDVNVTSFHTKREDEDENGKPLANSKSKSTSMSKTKSNIFSKIMSYHNQTDEDDEVGDYNTFSNNFSVSQ